MTCMICNIDSVSNACQCKEILQSHQSNLDFVSTYAKKWIYKN